MNATERAIEEMKAVSDFQKFGPKNWCDCPDCGSKLRVTPLESGRYELTLVTRLDDTSKRKEQP